MDVVSAGAINPMKMSVISNSAKKNLLHNRHRESRTLLCGGCLQCGVAILSRMRSALPCTVPVLRTGTVYCALVGLAALIFLNSTAVRNKDAKPHAAVRYGYGTGIPSYFLPAGASLRPTYLRMRTVYKLRCI